MDDRDLDDLHAAVRELLRPHLDRSEPLRRIVRYVGQLLVEEADRARTARDDEPDGSSPAPIETGVTEHVAAPPAHRPPEIEIAAELPLKVGGSGARVPVRGTAREIARARSASETEAASDDREAIDLHETRDDEAEIDLAIIQERCRLKAGACRLFVERRAAEGDDRAETPLLQRMSRMIADARVLPDCYLWVFRRDATQPDDAAMAQIARCYDAMAAAAGVAERLERLGQRAIAEDAQAALELGAEASSALRVALSGTFLTSDFDQDELHRWICADASARGIYVPRFMRLDDPADPSGVEDLVDRLATLDGRLERHAARLKRIREGFRKLDYHLGQLDPDGGEFDDHHYRKIAESIETLADLGVPPSDRRFRKRIDERVAGCLPRRDVVAPAVERVLESVHAWRAAGAQGRTAVEEPAAGSWSTRVLEVRSLLAGGAVVMIGGEPRNDAIERIGEAFALADLTWVRLSEHGSGQPMLAPIQRAPTRLVLVLVKLTGHLQAEDAARYAKAAGKPIVLLTAGYNPERIAEAVLQQASEQLRAGAMTSGS